MISLKQKVALRMERQFLLREANKEDYDQLYRDTQPGQNVYWHGFGQPPSITFRANFDDIAYNQARQQSRALVKGRFQGGNLGWVLADDFELFAGLSCKPLKFYTPNQELLLTLLRREGPMNIQLMKEMTGMLVKEITPVLHRLQEAFLIYEDQFDGEWDRAWYDISEPFPDVDIAKYSRQEALCAILPRFAYRNVVFDAKMVKSFYKVPEKEIKAAIQLLLAQDILVEADGMYILPADQSLLTQYEAETPPSIFVMHRNDFLVKSNEHTLKERFHHSDHETLQYLLIDGEFHGAVVGKFKYGPYILEDVLLDLPADEMLRRKGDIISAIYQINGMERPLLRYAGQEI